MAVNEQFPTLMPTLYPGSKATDPRPFVFPDWDAVADGSRPFHVYCDACINGSGAALEQEQTDGPIKLVSYVSRATLDSEKHWAPLDLEAGSIVWAVLPTALFLKFLSGDTECTLQI